MPICSKNLTADTCTAHRFARLQLQQVGRAPSFLWQWLSTSLRLKLTIAASTTTREEMPSSGVVGRGAQGRRVVLGCTCTLAARSWCPGTRASAPPRSRHCAARQGEGTRTCSGQCGTTCPWHRRFLVVSVNLPRAPTGSVSSIYRQSARSGLQDR